jgi:pentatricopeptide repeat protein
VLVLELLLLSLCNVFKQMSAAACLSAALTQTEQLRISHSSAAVTTGGQWEKAAELFDAMGPAGCKPDAITFSALISAYEAGGQWRRALKAFEGMQVGRCLSCRSCNNLPSSAMLLTGLLLQQS